MTEAEETELIERFAELAELGIGPDSYAFARGIHVSQLEDVCQRRWRASAASVADRMRKEPIRLLTRVLDQSRNDTRMLSRLLDMLERREARASGIEPTDPKLASMTREQLISETEKALAHERALIAAKLTG